MYSSSNSDRHYTRITRWRPIEILSSNTIETFLLATGGGAECREAGAPVNNIATTSSWNLSSGTWHTCTVRQRHVDVWTRGAWSVPIADGHGGKTNENEADPEHEDDDEEHGVGVRRVQGLLLPARHRVVRPVRWPGPCCWQVINSFSIQIYFGKWYFSVQDWICWFNGQPKNIHKSLSLPLYQQIAAIFPFFPVLPISWCSGLRCSEYNILLQSTYFILHMSIQTNVEIIFPFLCR